MRKFFSLLLPLVCFSAHAEWTYVGDNDGGRAQIYLDLPVIKRGNFPQMWLMRNYASGYRDQLGDVYFSEKVLHEYDCVSKQIRSLQIVQYSGTLGSGRVIYSSSSSYNDPWRYVAPSTEGALRIDIACGK
ncbi:hypothetical protein MCEMAEM21_01059 [Oxalobacteraceae bacterium]